MNFKSKRDLFLRFNPLSVENKDIEHDESAFEKIKEETLEAVRHERPRFNMPCSSSREGSIFYILEMGRQVLKKAGYQKELCFFDRVIDKELPFEEYLNHMHFFLDFSPLTSSRLHDKVTKEDEKSIEQLSKSIKVPADTLRKHILLHLQEHDAGVNNVFSYQSKNTADLWKELVAKKDVENTYGNNAWTALPDGAQSKWMDHWFAQLLDRHQQSDEAVKAFFKPTLPAESDPKEGDFGWVMAHFPHLGSHIDVFGKSGVMHHQASFESKMKVALFESIKNLHAGWEQTETTRFLFDHQNDLGFNEVAFLAEEAFDHLLHHSECPEGASGLTGNDPAWVTFYNRTHNMQWSKNELVWGLYQTFSPQGAKEVMTAVENLLAKRHQKMDSSETRRACNELKGFKEKMNLFLFNPNVFTPSEGDVRGVPPARLRQKL